MRPDEPIYERFSDTVQNAAPDILRFADAADTINRITEWATTDCSTLAFPRVSQVRFAVQRELNEQSVVFPSGTVYHTAAYDQYDASREGEAPSMKFESRIAVITGEGDDGKLASFFDKLEGIKKDKGSVAIVHMTAPVTKPSVYGIEAINFVVVKAKSNESFWFTIEPNDNKGKIVPIEAMQSEHGDLRDSYGPIDKLPIKAVPASFELRELMLAELKKAASAVIKEKQPQPRRSERIKEKANEVGRLMVGKYKSATSKS